VPEPVVPRYVPIANGFGFLDGFREQRGGAEVQSSNIPYGRDAATLGHDANQKVVRLAAEDGGHSRGIHYSRGAERTAIFLMHPRGDTSSHYLAPALLDAGYAVLGVQGRYFNNDSDCLHEALLADVAEGIRYLRSEGYSHVVLLGNSGGGSLFSYYHSTAETAPPGRPTETPGGTPYDLNALDLPRADGLLLLAAHLGEGKFMMNVIDPSLTDEGDPLSCDPNLDMYNVANGFRRPPEPSRYADEFVERYRAAQYQRVARLDAIARQQIVEGQHFQQLMREPAYERLPIERQIAIDRRAVSKQYIPIARTDANPASCDLRINPSQRTVGSLQGPRPDLQNYQLGFYAHCMTPDGWLSTWSGISSRASLVDTISQVTVPTYVLNYASDNAVFPQDAETVYQASIATDKGIRHIDGDHYGVTNGNTAARRSAKAEASEAVIAWLRDRYPAV
jgi:hypothetical protein